MHAHGKHMAPVTVVAVIAVVGTTALFFMNFVGPKNRVVQRSGISMITAAAVDRAGATALPTESTAQPTRPTQLRQAKVPGSVQDGGSSRP